MKIFLYLLLFWISTSFSLQAQINFQGCTAEFGTTTYVFFNTSTTNDGGTIRNTYETTPIDGTQPCNGLGFGFCEFRIIWSVANSRWEFQITDGVSFFMIYSNTSPSAPNPPDLTLGTWIENTANTGGACGGNGTASISTLTGDIQNSVGGGAPEIDVTGNSAGIVDGDATPSTIDGSDFGNVAVSTSALQTFVINNTGTAALNITSIVVSGAQASDFVVSGAPASVAAGASANFTLTFSPSAAGTRNATVTINNDDADEAVYDFAVRGNGTVSPEINLTGNGTGIIDGDATPSTIDGSDFGNVAVSTSALQTFVINNTGTGILTVSSILVSGTQAGDFVVSGAPASVAAGASANFTLTFSPSAAGTRNATVTINNDDADEAVYDFAVTGNGVGSPEISVRGNGNIILDGDVNPITVDGTDFGNVAVSTSSPQVFVIDNSAGTGVLTISSIVVSGPQAGDFVVSGAPASIAAGASANFTLTFTPSVTGLRNATVTINNDDADEGVYDFAVRGNDITFPTVAVTEWLSNSLGAEPDNEWVELYNYGATPVDLQNWRLKDEGADNDIITTSSYILQPGAYVILARDKAAFDNNWLQCSNGDVLEIPLVLANGADEIILEDNTGLVVWSVAYRNDETDGRSTYYTENTYTTRVWGNSAAPGVRRSGNDITTGTLGYEKNNATADPNARTAVNADQASPFDGVYQLADIVRGEGLEFDGTTNFVSINHDPSLQLSGGNFSIEYWARPNPNGNFQWVVSKDINNGNLDYLTGLNTSNQWRFIARNLDIDITAGPVVTAGTWYHVACTFDGTIARLYINGIEVGIDNTLGSPVTNTAPVFIGQRNGGQNFNGTIDEVRLWNVARTPTEIRENMHLTSTGCETGLVSYYQFNDGTGSTTLADKTDNANNGILVNMDAATDWVASGVNVGNDLVAISNSQTLAIATGTGTRQANFGTANLFMEFVGNTNPEDYTVTYQTFAPNSIAGITGTVVQDVMWTINKETAAPAPKMNLHFDIPIYIASPDRIASQYRLYWRPMNSDGNWTVIKNYAKYNTGITIVFTDIFQTGQFIITKVSEQSITNTRGNKCSFGGIDDFIEITNTINVPDDWTVELWLQPNTISNFENIIHTDFPNQNTGFRMELSNSFSAGQLYFSISDNNVFRPHTLVDLTGTLPAPVGGTFTAGQWYHVAVVGDVANNRVRAYLNGMLVVDAPHNNWPSSWPTTVLGRGFNTDANRDFNGSLDEVRFWGGARTQNEIRENMHLTLKGTEADLVGYYQFNHMDPFSDAIRNNGSTIQNLTVANLIPSEVAVAGGVSERMTVAGTGLMNFGAPKLAIDFGSSPNGEIVVSRLMTEKPHGWESITGDVDNEYFVINNYGSNQAPAINSMSFNEISHLAPAIPLTDINLYKRGSRDFGATWSASIAPASSITPSSNGNVTFAGAPLTTGFSQLVIAQNNVGSLPIELVSFEAERNTRQEVQLRWTTAMELNNKGFEVERMLEGETEFIKVAYVEGQGTSSGLHSYYQIDPNSFTNVSYYRLKQIDFDGTFSYSPTRAVEGMANPDGTGMSVFPNPTQGALNIQILDPIAPQKVYITLTDVQGRIVREHSTTISNERIIQLPQLLENLSNNLYFLHVQTVDGKKHWSQKISLQ